MTSNSLTDTPISEPPHQSDDKKSEPYSAQPDTTSFEAQMAEANHVMDEDREVLSELAK